MTDLPFVPDYRYNERNFEAMGCYVALREFRSFFHDYKYFAQHAL